MLLYHNSAACGNTEKKSASKSKRKIRKSDKKEYKCAGKSKHRVIPSKALSPPGRKKIKASNEKLSKKNQQFLKGLGLKVKESVEN